MRLDSLRTRSIAQHNMLILIESRSHSEYHLVDSVLISRRSSRSRARPPKSRDFIFNFSLGPPRTCEIRENPRLHATVQGRAGKPRLFRVRTRRRDEFSSVCVQDRVEKQPSTVPCSRLSPCLCEIVAVAVGKSREDFPPLIFRVKISGAKIQTKRGGKIRVSVYWERAVSKRKSRSEFE